MAIMEQSRAFAANGIFPSVFLAAVGFILAQTWVSEIGGSWTLRIFLGVPGISLLALGLRRAQLHWPPETHQMRQLESRRHLPDPGNFIWYALLLVCGAGTGALISAGSLFLLGIVASLMYLVPWVKVPVCRERFVISSTTMLAGAIAAMTYNHKPLQPMHHVAAAWILMVPPMMVLFLVIASLRCDYRVSGQIAAASANRRNA